MSCDNCHVNVEAESLKAEIAALRQENHALRDLVVRAVVSSVTV